MIGIFKEQTDRILLAAKKLVGKSNDGCFSPNEIAALLNMSRKEVEDKLDYLTDNDLCFRYDFTGIPLAGDECWEIRTFNLTVGKEYEVLAIYENDYIILSDPDLSKPFPNDPSLYPKTLFTVIDSEKPDFWITKHYYSNGLPSFVPHFWSDEEFFGDFHDKKPKIRQQFWNDLKKYYPKTWKERFGDSEVKPGM